MAKQKDSAKGVRDYKSDAPLIEIMSGFLEKADPRNLFTAV